MSVGERRRSAGDSEPRSRVPTEAKRDPSAPDGDPTSPPPSAIAYPRLSVVAQGADEEHVSAMFMSRARPKNVAFGRARACVCACLCACRGQACVHASGRSRLDILYFSHMAITY